METETQASPTAPPARPNLFRRAIENPVILKELRGRMRGRQAFWVLTGYLSLLGLVIGITYVSLAQDASHSPAWDPDYLQGLGKGIFGTVVILELFMVSLIGPALTAGAITSERERQTFDLLRTTSLSARSFVFGKLGSALAYLLLLIFAALPIESLAFVLGGVGLEEILVSSLMLVVTAVFYCALGLLFSSFMKRTSGASVLSYVTIVLSYVLLGVAYFLIALLGFNSSATGRAARAVMEDIAMVSAYLLASTNPLLAAIISEMNLIEEQSVFLMEIPLTSGPHIHLPAPWIIFIVLHTLLALSFIGLSILFVRRPDR